MQLPAETKPFLMGAAAGAVALAIVGFNWGGWSTAGKTEALAVTRSDLAVVTALAPLCMEKFQRSSDPAAKRAALKLVDTWNQGEFVEKEGWAAIGKDSPADRTNAVAKACATLVLAQS
ncbi:MAG: hypothetical protein ACKVQR_03255 [Aquabacterium sp.]